MAVARAARPDGPDGPDRLDQNHPSEAARRADSSLSSRHSRLADHLLAPEESFDLDRAAGLCAEVCRLALEELIPGLILIKPADREQFQARGAYLLALFDFARQPGIEGERLSQINRWEYNLELALDGEPIGQPIFVHLANCYAHNPWPDKQFARLGALARHRAASEDGLRGAVSDRWFLRIGGALREQFLGQDSAPELDTLFSAIARTQRLKSRILLQLRRRKAPQADGLQVGYTSDASVTQDEIGALQSELKANIGLVKMAPPCYRKATRYVANASLALLDRCQDSLERHSPQSLQLGIFCRLYLLLSSSLRS